jgi:hypothetical protein
MSVSVHKVENNLLPILKNYFEKEYGFKDDLSNIHTLLSSDKISKEDKEFHKEIKKFGVDDRKSVFIKRFHSYVDSCENFNEEYFLFLRKNVLPFFPGEEKILVQKTPNLRISFPNLTAIGKKDSDLSEDIIGVHSDSDFGHHSSEINFVVPITKMFDTNSIYYEPSVDSSIPYADYSNLKLETDEMCMAYFNKLRHYNKINLTGATRISFDFRVIPFSKYSENLFYFEGTKFELGSYYIIL